MLKLIIPCLLLVCLAFDHASSQTYVPTDYGSRKISIKSDNSNSTQGKLHLYLAPTSENEGGALAFVMEEIRRTAAALEAQKVQRKRQKKAVEMIRQEVESRYLRHYQGLADFSSLFKEKKYNDLTAAGLISMLLDELSMEHELFWYRDQAWIQLDDGTVLDLRQWGRNRPAKPAAGAEKAHLVAVVNAMQLASDSPLRVALVDLSSSPDQKRPLLPAELTGLLYYRRALSFYERGELTAAGQALDRARTFIDDPKIELVRYAILYQQAGKTEQDSTVVEPLFELYRLFPRRELTLELVRRFALLAEHYLLKEADQAAFEILYARYRQSFADQPTVLQQLKEIYFIEMAQFYAGKHQPAQVATYLDSLSKYRPHDTQVHGVLAPLLLRSLDRQKEPEEGLQIVEKYRQDFPFLRDEPLFRDLELCYRAELTRRAYDQDRENLGQGYLEEFERVLAQAGLTPRSELWITTAYTAASAYYFRNADYVNARWMNQRALALVPNDPFLLHRRDVLANY